jgi:hypothetical protein
VRQGGASDAFAIMAIDDDARKEQALKGLYMMQAKSIRAADDAGEEHKGCI